jgi:hypothetical protein
MSSLSPRVAGIPRVTCSCSASAATASCTRNGSDMAKKITCFYCGRERSSKVMVNSEIYRGKMICRQDVTTCLKLRAGTIHARNALK